TDYKTTPDQFAADGYDAVYTIAEAFKASGITDLKDKEFNAKMIDAMLKITVEGTTGKMTWSKDGEPAKSATAVKIVNGGYVAY
ncbi:MAG: amino acid ABC transporter substrate-binding protein, partial [Oscillospiraceae bacterium]